MIRKIIEDKDLGHNWRYYTTSLKEESCDGCEWHFYLCDNCKTQGYLSNNNLTPTSLPIKWLTINCKEIKFSEILA